MEEDDDEGDAWKSSVEVDEDEEEETIGVTCDS